MDPTALPRQAISDAKLGQQNARPGRIDLDLFAQVAHHDAQVVRVVEMRGAPDLPHDLLTRHDLAGVLRQNLDRKSTRLNSSHSQISYAVFCLKKKRCAVPPARSSRRQEDTLSSQPMSDRGRALNPGSLTRPACSSTSCVC